MARSKVTLNHVGMGQLLRSDSVRGLLTSKAQRVLSAAKADPHDDTGAYENGLHIEQARPERDVWGWCAGAFTGKIR